MTWPNLCLCYTTERIVNTLQQSLWHAGWLAVYLFLVPGCVHFQRLTVFLSVGVCTMVFPCPCRLPSEGVCSERSHSGRLPPSCPLDTYLHLNQEDISRNESSNLKFSRVGSGLVILWNVCYTLVGHSLLEIHFMDKGGERDMLCWLNFLFPKCIFHPELRSYLPQSPRSLWEP